MDSKYQANIISYTSIQHLFVEYNTVFPRDTSLCQKDNKTINVGLSSIQSHTVICKRTLWERTLSLCRIRLSISCLFVCKFQPCFWGQNFYCLFSFAPIFLHVGCKHSTSFTSPPETTVFCWQFFETTRLSILKTSTYQGTDLYVKANYA